LGSAYNEGEITLNPKEYNKHTKGLSRKDKFIINKLTNVKYKKNWYCRYCDNDPNGYSHVHNEDSDSSPIYTEFLKKGMENLAHKRVLQPLSMMFGSS
jgi:hypothetical protein